MESPKGTRIILRILNQRYNICDEQGERLTDEKRTSIYHFIESDPIFLKMCPSVNSSCGKVSISTA